MFSSLYYICILSALLISYFFVVSEESCAADNTEECQETAEREDCPDAIHCEVLPSHAEMEEPPSTGNPTAIPDFPQPSNDGSSDDDEAEHGDMIQNGFTPPSATGVNSEDDETTADPVELPVEIEEECSEISPNLDSEGGQIDQVSGDQMNANAEEEILQNQDREVEKPSDVQISEEKEIVEGGRLHTDMSHIADKSFTGTTEDQELLSKNNKSLQREGDDQVVAEAVEMSSEMELAPEKSLVPCETSSVTAKDVDQDVVAVSSDDSRNVVDLTKSHRKLPKVTSQCEEVTLSDDEECAPSVMKKKLKSCAADDSPGASADISNTDNSTNNMNEDMNVGSVPSETEAQDEQEPMEVDECGDKNTENLVTESIQDSKHVERDNSGKSIAEMSSGGLESDMGGHETVTSSETSTDLQQKSDNGDRMTQSGSVQADSGGDVTSPTTKEADSSNNLAEKPDTVTCPGDSATEVSSIEKDPEAPAQKVYAVFVHECLTLS